jgi:hypothetical protein
VQPLLLLVLLLGRWWTGGVPLVAARWCAGGGVKSNHYPLIISPTSGFSAIIDKS